MSRTSGKIDVQISNWTARGRMTQVKNGLINKIQTAIPTATIIDAWRLSTWKFSSFNGVLVSIKINEGTHKKLSYGNEITNAQQGQYMYYHFSLHVIARYDFTLEESGGLASEPAYNYANEIIKYLRTNNTDLDSGILDIHKFTARESDPSGGNDTGAHMSRIIIEGYILAERPIRQGR